MSELIPAPKSSTHSLGQETGGDGARHREEAAQLLEQLELATESPTLNDWERQFLHDCLRRLQEYGERARFSGKQVFRLRDLHMKLLERGEL